MAPWTTLTELFERVTHPGTHAGNLREEELRLAAAALLVHATAIDGEVAPEERRKLKALLQTHFELGDDETRRLLGQPKNNLGRMDLPTLTFAIQGVCVAMTENVNR